MKEINSKSRLGIALSKLKGFIKPKVRNEQYPTDPEIGAIILWNAYMKGEIEGKVSADLGCGTGILGIGALLLGAKKVYFVDNDKDALGIAKENVSYMKSEHPIKGEAVFLELPVDKLEIVCNTVIQNPPFGVKVRNADRQFLEKAIEVGHSIYSFHTSESKDFIKRFCENKMWEIIETWDFKFPLKATYSFHSRRIRYIDVSCFYLKKYVC